MGQGRLFLRRLDAAVPTVHLQLAGHLRFGSNDLDLKEFRCFLEYGLLRGPGYADRYPMYAHPYGSVRQTVVHSNTDLGSTVFHRVDCSLYTVKGKGAFRIPDLHATIDLSPVQLAVISGILFSRSAQSKTAAAEQYMDLLRPPTDHRRI